MNTDIEELLRDGMERFTTRVMAPAGLVRAAARRHRRRVAVRAAASGGGIAVAAAAVIFLTGVTGVGARTPAGLPHARDAAYVTRRVESALSNQNLVAVERTWIGGGPSVTWAYGPYYNWVQYWPATDHQDRIVNGRRLWDFPPADRGKASTATGTTVVEGQLYQAYVTYNDQRYSLAPLAKAGSYLPTSACSTTARLAMGGLPVPGVPWKQFINNTLRCGTASLTGKTRINRVLTTQITGKPVTVRLSAGYAKVIREKWATVQWKIYVNPVTYLPVRMYGATRTYGGKAGNQVSSGVTNVAWLQSSPGNIAKAMVTIPPGFSQYTGPADEQ